MYGVCKYRLWSTKIPHWADFSYSGIWQVDVSTWVSLSVPTCQPLTLMLLIRRLLSNLNEGGCCRAAGLQPHECICGPLSEYPVTDLLLPVTSLFTRHLISMQRGTFTVTTVHHSPFKGGCYTIIWQQLQSVRVWFLKMVTASVSSNQLIQYMQYD